MKRSILLVSLVLGCGSVPIAPAAIAHNTRGSKELGEGRLDDAEARFRLALELSPRFAEAHANLGLLLARRGDARAGLEELDRAVEIDANLAVAHAGRGAVLASLDRLPEAIEAYEAALAIQPEMPEPRRNLVQLLVLLERFREARAHALRLAQLEPARAETIATVAYCELALGRPDAALARVDEAVAVPRPAPALDLVRALALVALGRSDEGLAGLEALERDPDHGEAARVRRIALLTDLGRRQEAARLLDATSSRGDVAALASALSGTARPSPAEHPGISGDSGSTETCDRNPAPGTLTRPARSSARARGACSNR